MGQALTIARDTAGHYQLHKLAQDNALGVEEKWGEHASLKTFRYLA